MICWVSWWIPLQSHFPFLLCSTLSKHIFDVAVFNTRVGVDGGENSTRLRAVFRGTSRSPASATFFLEDDDGCGDLDSTRRRAQKNAAYHVAVSGCSCISNYVVRLCPQRVNLGFVVLCSLCDVSPPHRLSRTLKFVPASDLDCNVHCAIILVFHHMCWKYAWIRTVHIMHSQHLHQLINPRKSGAQDESQKTSCAHIWQSTLWHISCRCSILHGSGAVFPHKVCRKGVGTVINWDRGQHNSRHSTRSNCPRKSRWTSQLRDSRKQWDRLDTW